MVEEAGKGKAKNTVSLRKKLRRHCKAAAYLATILHFFMRILTSSMRASLLMGCCYAAWLCPCSSRTAWPGVTISLLIMPQLYFLLVSLSMLTSLCAITTTGKLSFFRRSPLSSVVSRSGGAYSLLMDTPIQLRGLRDILDRYDVVLFDQFG